MSRSSSPQTTTTTAEAPAYLRPYLQQAAEGAAQQYAQGGTPPVNMSTQTQQALQLAQARSLGGSPVTDAAQNYATQSLEGGFMGSNPFLQGGANPHLDATFNQAATATRNQLASEFAQSGRNVRASEGLRGEQLNNLATNIYGGAYETDANRRLAAYQGERSLQQGVIPFAGQIANQDYADIGQLANVGQTYDDLNRQLTEWPARNLDDYMARLAGLSGGYGTTTSQTPMQRNALAGALGGASAGAMLGPWGMLGGAVLGGLYG